MDVHDAEGAEAPGREEAEADAMKMKKGARRSGEPRLYSSGDAAKRLGVRQTNVRPLLARAGIEPYDRVGATTLWRADEVDMLAGRRGESSVPASELLTPDWT
jgi:hypothetical protein